MFKLDLAKAEEAEIKLPVFFGDHKKAREFQKKKIYFIEYAKVFDCVDHNKLWEILKEMGIPDHLSCLLRPCMQVRKQHLELDLEEQTGSKIGKEYVKTVYCHLAYLSYMQVHHAKCGAG